MHGSDYGGRTFTIMCVSHIFCVSLVVKSILTQQFTMVPNRDPNIRKLQSFLNGIITVDANPISWPLILSPTSTCCVICSTFQILISLEPL